MAKKHALSHVTYSLVVMFVIMLVIMLNKDFVSRIFTSDPEDINYIHEVLDLIAAYLMLDAIHGVNTGIVRALGKQFAASVTTLVIFYAIGLPLALVFGFKLEMGIRGFWLGFTIALIFQDLLVTLIICRADWAINEKANKAHAQSMKLAMQNSFSHYDNEEYLLPDGEDGK